VPLWVTFVGLALAAIALAFQAPQLDPSTTLLQPKHCEAQSALDELESEMSRAKQPCLVVLAGADETDVADRLSRTATVLHQARADRTIQDYMLPEGLWPRPNWSGTNLAAAVAVAAEIDRLRSAARRAGFTEDAVRFAEAVTSQWSARAGARGAIWPTNQSARWILRRSAARTSDGWLAAGMLWGGTNATLRRDLLPLYRADAQTWVTGWPLLPEALLNHVTDRFAWLMAAGMGLVAASLRLAFHRWSDVLLSGLTIAFSLTILSALMGIAGWEWNLMTLMALPLLLGAGVDYTIHVQLALHRHGGDVRELRRITGRAVLLCAGTSVAGFGSNALSTNSGLAAMGAVCATGLAIVCLTAVFLLPGWWIAWHRRAAPEVAHHTPAVVHTPSALYHAKIWNLARTVAGLLPGTVAEWLGQALAASYARLHSARRRVVERNLLPACAGNPDAARQATRRLYSNFGVKMARLLRRETKAVDEAPPAHWSGWEVLTAAQARGQGVLLVTPHLGDWELGGYLLAQRGVPLLVLTQAEPGARLTEQRSRSRARWGIETLVVGQDPFAFVEILKRLQAGTVVALLLDRPAAGTDAEVELFGRPFRASSAAAELARASGCAVLPVYVIQGRGGTETHVLPEITYDRGQLGSREARRHLTQAIVRVFEPVIARHVDQWYHFIPIWPEPGA
jgi:lauroyl/myristoyl acyltransferase